jgi:hypothetical protein
VGDVRREGFTADSLQDCQLAQALLLHHLQRRQQRIVFRYYRPMVELVLEPLPHRAEVAEVDDPAAIVETLGLEL